MSNRANIIRDTGGSSKGENAEEKDGLICFFLVVRLRAV